MKIKQLLAEKPSKQVESILPNATLQHAAQKLIEFRIGALVVTDEENHMMGIVSERDLIPVVANYADIAFDTPVSEMMTRSVITCDPDDEIAYILRLMNSNAIRHMPVLEQGKLVEMVSIRELTRAYELLQVEANTDPLTELSNRRPFLRTLENEFARARRFKHPLVVGMIDIDHFKNVNDTYGHDAGDKVLRSVSGMLISEFRTIDHLGRLGGEEFAIIFPETDLAGAHTASERLRANIQSAVVLANGQQISVTVSIGLAQVSSATLDGSAVLKRADELLYVAKRGGRNRVVIESEHHEACAAPIQHKTMETRAQ